MRLLAAPNPSQKPAPNPSQKPAPAPTCRRCSLKPMFFMRFVITARRSSTSAVLLHTTQGGAS